MSYEDIARQLTDLQTRVSRLERQEPPLLAALYTTDAGQSIGDASFTVVDFEDLVLDTHSAVTTGAAWKFTTPIGGVYYVACTVIFDTTTAWAEAERLIMRVTLDGTEYRRIGHRVGLDSSSTTALQGAGGSTLVQANASQDIAIEVYQETGSSLTLVSSAAYNHIAIVKR